MLDLCPGERTSKRLTEKRRHQKSHNLYLLPPYPLNRQHRDVISYTQATTSTISMLILYRKQKQALLQTQQKENTLTGYEAQRCDDQVPGRNSE